MVATMLERTLTKIMLGLSPVGVFCIGGYAVQAFKHASLFEALGVVLMSVSLLFGVLEYLDVRKEIQS